MKVLLDPDIERLVQATVESGKYRSPKEVVREALVAFLKTDPKLHARVRRLQKEIELGFDDIAAGNIAKFDAAAIKRSARRRLSSRQA